MSTKQVIVLGASVVLGNMVAEKFVLKVSDSDPTGFVMVAPGLGLDDFARAATIVAIAFVVGKFL